MLFFFVFGIDKDVIKIYYYKDIKLLYSNRVDIALKTGQYVDQSKRYDLIFEVAIVGLKYCLLFITFFKSYLIVGID